MRISDWSSDVCSSDLVVAHPRNRIGFDERNMFVRRSVKDGVGPMAAIDAHWRRSLGNIAKFEDDRNVDAHCAGHRRQFLFDCVERVFGLFEKDQARRMASQDLAAQFAAYRTADRESTRL